MKKILWFCFIIFLLCLPVVAKVFNLSLWSFFAGWWKYVLMLVLITGIVIFFTCCGWLVFGALVDEVTKPLGEETNSCGEKDKNEAGEEKDVDVSFFTGPYWPVSYFDLG